MSFFFLCLSNLIAYMLSCMFIVHLKQAVKIKICIHTYFIVPLDYIEHLNRQLLSICYHLRM